MNYSDLDAPKFVRLSIRDRSFLTDKAKLENASPKLKSLVQSPMNLFLTQLPELKLPYDDLEAWKYLLHYIAHPTSFSYRDLRIDCDAKLLVRLYILGDKYEVRDFMANTKLHLLRYYDNFDRALGFNYMELKELFTGLEPCPKDPTKKYYGDARELVAEEIVKRQEWPPANPDRLNRELYDDIHDLATLLESLRTRFGVVDGLPPDELFRRFGAASNGVKRVWNGGNLSYDPTRM